MIAAVEVAEARSIPSTTPENRVAPLHIAYFVSRFPKLTETFILNELLALQDAGDRITVYPLNLERTGPRHPDVARIEDRVRYVRYLSSSAVGAAFAYLRSAPRALAATLFTAIRENFTSPKFLVRTLAIIPKSIAIARAAEQERVDHIHAHFATHATTAAYIVHRLTGIPFSFTAHAYDIYVDRHMLREKARLAHSIVVVSETNRRLMVDCCGSEIESKLNVVRNGVDSDRFAAGNEHVQRDCLQVLCVGGLEAKKGQQHLIEACRILKQRGIALRCIVIGDGPLRLQLERQIHEADVADAVELIGGQPHPVVAEHMRAADIVALPSVVTTTGKTEGLPVVLTEALACERAVVATRVAGVLELVIDGETGLLVAPGDAQALADALERLHRDPTLRRRLGQAGRRRVVSEYDPSRNVARLRALFATPDR